MTSNRAAMVFGGVLAAFLLLSLIAFTVRSTEVACVATFGKPGRPITDAGLYWKAPWPIQRVYKFDARLQNYEGKFEQTYTKDGKNLILMVYAGWRIANPITFLERVGTADDAQRNLDGLIRTYKNGVLGKHEFSSLVSLDPEQLQFETIEKEMLEAIKKGAAERYGIEVAFLGIKMIGLPAAITQKVFDRMRSERLRIAGKLVAEGRERAGKVRAQAEEAEKTIIAEAEAQAKRIKGDGDAEAAKSLAVLRGHEDFAIFLRKREALETTLKERSTVIFDAKIPPYDLFGKPGGPAK